MTNTLKWYEDKERKEIMVKRLKANYQERLKTDITLQIKKTEFYINWRNKVLNHYNGNCEICGEKVLETSITFRKGTYKEVFTSFNIVTLNDAMNCFEMWKPENTILRCVKCVKGYGRNKKTMVI